MTPPAESQPGRESVTEVPTVPPSPESARELFGSRLGLAERYAGRLATDGVTHGHIGPREVPRLWERHLINSALVAELIGPGAAVVDIGSGAGLPGLPIAIRRPDLRVTLVEPMLRRSQFLSDCVADLGLQNQIGVIRGRAEERSVIDTIGGAEWLVARAVAPLDRLARWCLPLLAPGGMLLAMKGSRAIDEVAQHQYVMQRLGADAIDVVSLGEVDGDEGTWVVAIRRDSHVGSHRKARRR